MPGKYRISHIANCLSLAQKSIKQATRNRRGAKSQLGFTLIEILIALFIIAVIAAILLTAGGGLFTNRTQKLDAIAIKIVAKDIENLRKIPFTDVAALPSPQTLTDSDLLKLPNVTAATRTISDYGSPADPMVKHVTIAITWGDTVPKTYITDTLIYQNGL